MEIFRSLGVADKINKAAVPADICHDVGWVTSLTGYNIYRYNYPGPNEARQINRQVNDGTQPMDPAVRISQIVVEPLLRDAAAESSKISIIYGLKFLKLEQDERGVIAWVEEASTGKRKKVRSAYLVGCDGGNSPVRRNINITLSGEANIRKRYSVHFRSKDKNTFEPWGAAWHYQSPVHGTLVSQDGKERYTLHSFLLEGESDSNVNPYDKVRSFVGSDFDFELIEAVSWNNNLLVADSYRRERVFLAGDSSHQYIPTGGYGMNTGVGDAYDLGWKLSAILNGWGGEGLLGSYEEERRPIALRNCNAAKQHAEARLAIGNVWSENIELPGPEGDKARDDLATKIIQIGNAENESLGIELGYSYAGSSIVCNNAEDQYVDDALRYYPTTTPGYRPPGVYLEDGTAVFDLFGPGFTLLNFNPDAHDVSIIQDTARSLDMPLKLCVLRDLHVKELYKYDLLILRPDQHVAWRGNVVPKNLMKILTKLCGF